MGTRRDLGLLGGAAVAAAAAERAGIQPANAQTVPSASQAAASNHTIADGPDTLGFLRGLHDTMRYNLGAIEREIRELEQNPSPTAVDRLKARAFVLSFVGNNTSAARALEVLVSQEQGRTSRNLGKLAQVLTRRAQEGDAANALRYARLGLDLARDPSERWLANQTMAVAALQLDRLDEARASAEAALREQEDPRSRAVLEIVEAQRSAPTAPQEAAQPGMPQPQAFSVMRNLVVRGVISPETLLSSAGAGLGQPIRLSREDLTYFASREAF